jgi:RNA polymerase sigma-70 factor (ECF subfamily)
MGGRRVNAFKDVPDVGLIDRHRSGDRDAFAELVRRHRDRLWAVALRTLGDPEEAADALQDAFLSAFRAAERFRGESAVTTWLHRIVVNACLDRARRAQVRRTVPLPEEQDGDEHSGPPVAISPDHAPARETALDVTAALATLPLEQRAAIVLIDIHGYSVDEAARILDVAPGTVKSRCARGRARMLPLVAHLRRGNPPTGPAVQAKAQPAAAEGGE